MPTPTTKSFERRKGPNSVLYSKSEFDNWYGGLLEWHGAPAEDDAGHHFKKLVESRQKQKAHEFLVARGVDDEETRQRVMDRIVPPPRPKNMPPPKPEVERYPAAAEALKAKSVSLFMIAGATDTALVVNCVRSLSSCEDADVAMLGSKLPITIYCTDTASYDRLCGLRPVLRSAALTLVALHEDDALQTKCATLAPAERREWLACEVIRRALVASRFTVYLDAATHVERAGSVGYILEALAVEAAADGVELSVKAPSAAADAFQERRDAGATVFSDAAEASVLGKGIELLLTTAGVEYSGTDGPLGRSWLKLLAAPKQGVEMTEPDACSPRAKRLERLRDILLAKGATLKPAEALTLSAAELAGLSPLDLCVGAYVSAGTGSGSCHFQLTGAGLSTGVIAARRTAATQNAFEVDPASVVSGWTIQSHLNRHLPGRVAHRTLPLALYPNGEHWIGGAREKTRLASDLIPQIRRFKLLSFSGGWLDAREKRMLMEREGRWVVGDDVDAEGSDDGEEEEVVIV